MATEHKHNGLTLIEVNDNLVFLVDKHGRHYATCDGEKALDNAKQLTDLYWGEIASLGSPVYTSELQRSSESHNEFLRNRVGQLEKEIEELRARITYIENCYD